MLVGVKKLVRRVKKGEMPVTVVFFYSESLYPIFQAAFGLIRTHRLPYLLLS